VPGDHLTLPPDELRALGHRVVDVLVDQWTAGRERPPVTTRAPAELAALGGPPPDGPGDPAAALERLVAEVLPAMQHGDHPRYFARVPSPANPVAVLGDWLASATNAIATSWAGGSGPAAVELVVLDWLRGWLGLPEGTEGVLVSGGSVASLTCLAAALDGVDRPRAVLYASDQAHASVLRAARLLGVGHVRVLGSDDALRLRAADVAAAVEADRAAGLQPWCVVGTAGTTSTGAVDPLAGLADLGLWLHVDAAYGGPAALTARGRALLGGLERADSAVVDPHKWLFQPYEIGCALVRRPGALGRAFAMLPEYLRETQAGAGEVDFRDRGPQLTRGARALKLWLTLHAFGLDAVRAAVDRGIDLAERAEARAREHGFGVVTPAQLGIVTFAPRRPDPAVLVARATADGACAPSTTILHGRTVVRLCTINPRTTDEELDASVAALAALDR
jgi:aromatic-L-amino-acid/L-tryptophan decarboxylase